MSSVRRRLAAGALALFFGVPTIAACTGSEDEPGPVDASPRVTSLEEMATEDVTVVRAGFCPRVAPTEIRVALGGDSGKSETWDNGDRVAVAGGRSDVVHEYGCSWTAGDGTVARAWVFAPPVGTDQARRLAEQGTKAQGCRPLADAETFGAPSAAVRCATDGRAATAYHGLFGDAWLSCSLEAGTEPDPESIDRWCAAVLQAAGS